MSEVPENPSPGEVEVPNPEMPPTTSTSGDSSNDEPANIGSSDLASSRESPESAAEPVLAESAASDVSESAAELAGEESAAADVSESAAEPVLAESAASDVSEPAAEPAATPSPAEAETAPESAAAPAAPPVQEEPPNASSTSNADPVIGATASPDTPIPEPVRPDSDAGKIVGGSITAVSSEEIALTLDDGRSAVINRRNFDEADTDPSTVYQIGDRAEGAILTREDPKQRVVLSRAWALKKRAWEKVGEAAEAGGLLSGTITGVSKRGVVVDAGVRGFVPSSHLELNPVSDLSGYVGQTLDFKVLEVDPAKERLVLSRRSILLKEQRRATHDLLSGLEPGEVRTGTVSSLADYGAFVDLGGVNGLVHLSELSWQRVNSPSDVVSVGQQVEVKVLDVKVKKRRVGLSIRQLTDDPLAAVIEGSIMEGPVSRLVDFGAFVDLGGVEGLVHLSELAEYRVSTPEEIVFPGEVVRAKVLSVDKKRRRIELSIRQAVSGDFG